MLAKIRSMLTWGIEVIPVEVEVDISRGLPAISLVGLADTALKESKERVKSAIKNCGFEWPFDRITISLTPSELKKSGALFDLPIALAILAASEQIPLSGIADLYALGELSLDGALCAAKGVLPICLNLAATRQHRIIMPAANAAEAALVEEVIPLPAKDLKEAAQIIMDPQRSCIQAARRDAGIFPDPQYYPVDFTEVKGQYAAKRGLEVAVAGGHNVLMIGPPGSGKSMLARRIPTIMPDLTTEESFELTKVYSVCGKEIFSGALIKTRPFRSPHHGASLFSLTGGGAIPQPGEISLAHHGVLFLDELPEFKRETLEALRQPMEEGRICVCRASRATMFPASFMLVCAMNPCPCGYYSHTGRSCRCTASKVQAYRSRISGPLTDRIDIHLELPAIRCAELSAGLEPEPSSAIKTRVEHARMIQRTRLKHEGVFCNAQMAARHIKKYCAMEKEAEELLHTAMQELRLSLRAYDKILKVARTIADLAGRQVIQAAHIAEAVHYRAMDREY